MRERWELRYNFDPERHIFEKLFDGKRKLQYCTILCDLCTRLVFTYSIPQIEHKYEPNLKRKENKTKSLLTIKVY